MYVQYDIDIISILILGIVLFNNVKNSGGKQLKQWLFRSLIICNMLLLLFDMLIYIIYKKPGLAAHILIEIFQCYFFALCSLFCFLWALFCTLRPGYRQGRSEHVILCIPLLILVGFLLANYSNGLIFRITDSNEYERGPFFHITTLCTYSYIVYSIIRILKSRSTLTKNEFYPFIITPALPIVTGIIQLALRIDVLIVWPSCALGLLLMQFYSLDEKINLDHLTGLYNRKYLDGLIEDMIQMGRISSSARSNKRFAALMLDIDNFKTINDTYGHVEGDSALRVAAEILNKSVRKGDFVSRYGGDEFLIILDQCTSNTPARVINRINESAKKYNEDHDLPYRIEFSVGYKVFSNVNGLSGKDMLASIDELMYKNKHSKTSGTSSENIQS
jgi:diguanylate cyclase (GGDEF)-like protein